MSNVGASGFSQNNDFPVANVASTSSRCVAVGVVIITASTAGSSITRYGSAWSAPNGQLRLAA